PHDDCRTAAPVRTTAPVRATPRAVAPPRAPRIVVRRGVIGRPIGPEIDRLRCDERIGVVVVADLGLLAAAELTDDRDVAALLVFFRIVEAAAAGEEAPVARIARDRPRYRIEIACEDLEAGLVGTRIDIDDLTTPAHDSAAGARRGLTRCRHGELSLQRRRNRSA